MKIQRPPREKVRFTDEYEATKDCQCRHRFRVGLVYVCCGCGRASYGVARYADLEMINDLMAALDSSSL